MEKLRCQDLDWISEAEEWFSGAEEFPDECLDEDSGDAEVLHSLAPRSAPAPLAPPPLGSQQAHGKHKTGHAGGRSSRPPRRSYPPTFAKHVGILSRTSARALHAEPKDEAVEADCTHEEDDKGKASRSRSRLGPLLAMAGLCAIVLACGFGMRAAAKDEFRDGAVFAGDEWELESSAKGDKHDDQGSAAASPATSSAASTRWAATPSATASPTTPSAASTRSAATPSAAASPATSSAASTRTAATLSATASPATPSAASTRSAATSSATASPATPSAASTRSAAEVVAVDAECDADFYYCDGGSDVWDDEEEDAEEGTVGAWGDDDDGCDADICYSDDELLVIPHLVECATRDAWLADSVDLDAFAEDLESLAVALQAGDPIDEDWMMYADCDGNGDISLTEFAWAELEEAAEDGDSVVLSNYFLRSASTRRSRPS